MATIAQTVSEYIDRIEQNKVSIKAIDREIADLQSTKTNTTTELYTLQGRIGAAITPVLDALNAAIPLDATTGLKIHPDYEIKWTYYNYDWSAAIATGVGNCTWGYTTSYSYDYNQTNRWAVVYQEVGEFDTTYPTANIGFSFYDPDANWIGAGPGWNQTTYQSLATDMYKWRLLFHSISKPPSTDGAYGIDSQISSKTVAKNFLISENNYMTQYINQFG